MNRGRKLIRKNRLSNEALQSRLKFEIFGFGRRKRLGRSVSTLIENQIFKVL